MLPGVRRRRRGSRATVRVVRLHVRLKSLGEVMDTSEEGGLHSGEYGGPQLVWRSRPQLV